MEIKAKKSLGQHFLKDKSVVKKMIECSSLHAGDLVCEVGPGTGVLTEALVSQGAHIVAIETDERAISILKDKFGDKIELIHGDIAQFNIENRFEGRKYKLIANIPYYITGLIISMFLDSESRPETMTLLVQKEVAERIMARDGKESILSLSVKAFGNPSIVTRVPRGAFEPAPSVDSAVICIKNIHRIEENVDNVGKIGANIFFKLIKAGFLHKRKYLSSNLSNIWSREKINQIWSELAIDEKIRAEEIDLKTWFDIGYKISQ
jgi:16S rRNA (adenine1518-N6/adenine1519-N6)-dimethyltransferase